jgi:alpha-glucosidase
MAFCKFLVCLLLLLAGAAHAQDELRVASPDGQLEFRLFTTLPEGAQLNSLAYQVRLRGKLLVDTSCLGWNIHFQEPFLGENVGLSSSKSVHEAAYNGLTADFLQNSSTGRRIQIEVRVWNDGVAFRYLIPKQWPLIDLLIEDEVTEFHFAYELANGRPAQAALPYIEPDSGAGWVGIFESRVASLPPMSLVRSDTNTMISHLADKPTDPGVAFEGVTPWTSPWRMIVIGPDRDRLAKSDVVRALP